MIRGKQVNVLPAEDGQQAESQKEAALAAPNEYQ